MAPGLERDYEVVHSRVLQLVADLFSSGCIQTQDVTTLQRPLPDDAMKIVARGDSREDQARGVISIL